MAQGPVRLLLTSTDPECLNLPWELLPGPNGRFLVADARYAIRRSTRAELAPASPSLAAPPLRILFTACAPTDQPGLDYEKEEEAILRIVQKLGGKVHLEIAEAGTFDELRELIVEHRPHIVHLSGHGSVHEGIGSFAFENESGRCDSRDAREMAAQLFAGQGVRLVFMNGCQTAQAAVAGVCQTLTAEGHVPLALGWSASIADDLATEFARVFFHEIAAGLPVDHAVAAARAELLARGRYRDGVVDLLDASFALPQLHAANDADALFDHRLPPDPPERPGVSYKILGDQIRGLEEGFVGRRRQLQKLGPALRAGAKKVALLTGIGGAGKSTLATRLTNWLERDGFKFVAVQARRDEAHIFCVRMLTELASACNALARAAMDECDRIRHQRSEAELLDGQRPIDNRLRLAVEILNEAKILLVLDNLESLLPLPPAVHAWELPEVAAFFSTLISRLTGQGRAILTCRYFPAGFDPAQPNLAHEAMPDFTEADFFKYLRRHARVAERMERGELSRELIENFHRKLGATPRFVEQASAILATLDADRLGEQLDTLAAPAEGTAGDDLWQLQQGYFRDLFLPQLYDTLSPPHRLALSRLALVREALPLDGVARVAGLEPGAAAEFVGRCVGLSLLQRFGEKGEDELFAVYPLQREFFTAPKRLPVPVRKATHLSAAEFFRENAEHLRSEDPLADLLACLHHATEAGEINNRIWAGEKLASWLCKIGEFATAKEIVRPILSEVRHSDLLRVMAGCANDTGDWGMAQTLYKEEQMARNAASDTHGEAIAWSNLGTVELKMGSFTSAKEAFGKALTMHRQLENQLGEAEVLNNIATVDLEEGNRVVALKGFEAALKSLEMLGKRKEATIVLHNIARIEMELGQYAPARQKFEMMLAEQLETGEPMREANAWHSLASIDARQGDLIKARERFLKALAIRQSIGDQPGEAHSSHEIGIVDVFERCYAAACKRFGHALGIRQAIGDRLGEANTLYEIGALAAYTGKLDIGIRLVGICLTIEKQHGAGGVQDTMVNGLTPMASALNLDSVQVQELLAACSLCYERDRGVELVRQAFAGL